MFVVRIFAHILIRTRNVPFSFVIVSIILYIPWAIPLLDIFIFLYIHTCIHIYTYITYVDLFRCTLYYSIQYDGHHLRFCVQSPNRGRRMCNLCYLSGVCCKKPTKEKISTRHYQGVGRQSCEGHTTIAATAGEESSKQSPATLSRQLFIVGDAG